MLRRDLACPAEQRSGLLARCLGRLPSLALLLGAACREDAVPVADSAVVSAGTDAGERGGVHAFVDAGPVHAVVDAGAARTNTRFATATVDLNALGAADGGASFVGGKAAFRATSEGVDLEIALTSCVAGAAYRLSIVDALDAAGCAQVASSEAGSPLGERLPPLHCLGLGGRGAAGTGHSRSAMNDAPWTLGDGSASDLVGRLLIVRDGALGTPVACGLIARSDDVIRPPMPPADQAPSIAARASIGGGCLGRMYPGSTPRCFDDAALLNCEAVHCEIGSCLQTCAAYAKCLDQEDDVCAPAASCDFGADCDLCMSQVQQCSKSFCAEYAFCGALPTPDGPCHRLANCCALQGKDGDAKLAVIVPLVAGLGGDENCVGSMNDWAVLSQWKVPCLFAASDHAMTSPTVSPPARLPFATGPLADGVSGAACKTDAECRGGRCAPVAKQGAGASTDASGYCTRACDNSSQCGRGGTCVTSQATEGKECLAACTEQADCRSGFACTGGVHGSGIVLPGACHAWRQPDQLADQVAGRACQADTDCDGGKCTASNLLGTTYPGNYCTARCYEDAQCGQGGVCLWTRNSDALGYCLASCDVDADCAREEYGCWEMSDGTRLFHACYPRKRSLPDRRAGQPCIRDADCGAPDATCAKQLPYSGLATNDVIDAPGGYCTQRCALDRECGEGAQCINYGTSGGLCFATCTNDTNCRTGYTCFPHLRNSDETDAVCVVAS